MARTHLSFCATDASLQVFTCVSTTPLIHMSLPAVILSTGLGKLSVTVAAPNGQVTDAAVTQIRDSLASYLVDMGIQV